MTTQTAPRPATLELTLTSIVIPYPNGSPAISIGLNEQGLPAIRMYADNGPNVNCGPTAQLLLVEREPRDVRPELRLEDYLDNDTAECTVTGCGIEVVNRDTPESVATFGFGISNRQTPVAEMRLHTERTAR